MRTFLLMLLVTLGAFTGVANAGQTIVCRQVGNSKAKLEIFVMFNRLKGPMPELSAVKARHMGGDLLDGKLDSLTVEFVEDSAPEASIAYTTFFFATADGSLDLQLQFKSRILRMDFDGVAATFRIGSAAGGNLVCRGRMP